ncbi:hypothetical protein PALI_a0474 [Pseudoalteromonas aliena SW19]|uniref:Uncharacterized protein n=1 Tax=Pseudoalteromonas aliena SW19 TaxID=1314866 RepID=A0ABR9DY08_9GAMM|nr:hypothetical protein [Pseudoalteromonas aliena SW19]
MTADYFMVLGLIESLFLLLRERCSGMKKTSADLVSLWWQRLPL